ncbi:MAG: hypothetical protein AB7I04_24310, partial [Pseudomonadales bacterium]
RPSIGPVASWNGWLALAAWGVNLAWTTVAGAFALPGWLDWIVPDVGQIGVQTLLGLTASVIGNGGETLDGILVALRNLAVLVVCAGAAWLLLGRVVQRRSLCLASALMLTGLIAAPDIQAFELRHDDDRVTLTASETVDDTLITSADRILIEGTVTGDLIAVGEEITIRGPVGGTLLAFGEKVTIESEIGGNVVTAAETVLLDGASIRGNLYGAGEAVTVRENSRIGGNAAMGAEQASMLGVVERDVWLGAENATVSGSVSGDLRAYAAKVALTDGASVGGDLFAKVASEDDLTVAAGAEVNGATAVETWPEPENPYLTIEYYLGIVLRLAAALLAGFVLFHLFPSLAETRIDDGMQALATAGIGAVVLVATPILALVAVFTLVGAPLGIIAFLLYLMALYLAGILTANQIGRLLPGGSDGGRMLPLLAGLGVVFVLVNLPVVGGVFRLVAVIVGLGLLLLWIRDRWQTRSA